MFLEEASSISEFFGVAEAGDITVHMEIAWMYQEGEGFQQDFDRLKSGLERPLIREIHLLRNP